MFENIKKTFILSKEINWQLMIYMCIYVYFMQKFYSQASLQI